MDAWLERLARRNGRAYFIGAVIAAVLISYLGIVPAITLVPCHYFGMTFEEFLQMLALCWLLMTWLALAAAFVARRELVTIWGWLGGREDLRLPATKAVFELPWRLIGVMFVLAVPLATPLIVYSLTHLSDYRTTADYVCLTIGSVLSIAAAGAAGAYLIDTFCRPARIMLDADEPQPIRHGGLGWRLVTAILCGTVYGGLAVGYLSTNRADAGAHHLYTVYLISFGGGLITAALFAPMQVSILGPIRDLRRGTARVADGGLDTHVPITTADELGRLVVDFNVMIADVRASRARVVSAGNEARRRVERDLHDGAQQRLVLLGLKLSAAERTMGDRPEYAAAVAECRSELHHALEELRDLARGIYPASLADGGLVSAVGEAVQRAGLPATFEHDSAGRYDPEVETAVYFCCVEALQNAAKHAGEGATASVVLEDGGDELRFTVSDHGVGFAGDVDSGAGLRNMDDRLGALGGRVVVESAPGAGTVVRGRVPL